MVDKNHTMIDKNLQNGKSKDILQKTHVENTIVQSQITKNFPKNTLTQAINFIVYGKPVLKKFTMKRKTLHTTVFYLQEDDFSLLQWISKKKLYSDSRIDLKSVVNISDNPTQNALKKIKSDRLLCLTLGETQFLAIEFPDVNTKELWWQGIQYFILLSKSQQNSDNIQNVSHKLFLKYDKDGTKYLDKNETKSLLNEMHVNISAEVFEKTFKTYDKNHNNQIDYEEFKQMMIQLSMKKEVIPIFHTFCKQAEQGMKDIEENVMTAEELRNFFIKAQNQVFDIEKDINPMIAHYNLNDNGKKSNELSFLNFCNLLFSKSNEIYNDEKSRNFQDMNQPLSSYWINSSHNTYLLSNQLTGESSTQAYVNAFQKGCRCVELDCWDGEKGEPIVYHGHTLTSKIFFEDIIKVVKDYAFVKNPYPVILSLENHCTKKQQDRMAQIMRNILGDLLFYLPKDWENTEYFPSPNELKKKILIKDKASLHSVNENFNEEQNEDVKADDVSESHHIEFKTFRTISGASYLKKPSMEGLKFESENKIVDDFDQEKVKKNLKNSYGYQLKNIEEIENKIMAEYEKKKTVTKPLETISEKMSPKSTSLNKKKKKVQETSSELFKLITMFGCKMVLGDSERLTWNISSLSEDKVLKQLQTNEVEFIDHNKWTFTRTYPGGLRIDSSNYDPMPAFITGCHVIALNFQTNDLNLQIYLSKFQINGGVNCGYLLKPDFMLLNSQKPKYPKDFVNPVFKLVIKIISATQLKPMKKNERDIIDPFVEVSLRGLPIEEKNNSVCKTKMVPNNGFNPIFGENFTFEVYCPEIAILVFQVFDQDNLSNEKIGSYAIPVDCLRPGFRVVPLKNTLDFNFIENSFIFCNIEKKLY